MSLATGVPEWEEWAEIAQPEIGAYVVPGPLMAAHQAPSGEPFHQKDARPAARAFALSCRDGVRLSEGAHEGSRFVCDPAFRVAMASRRLQCEQRNRMGIPESPANGGAVWRLAPV